MGAWINMQSRDASSAPRTVVHACLLFSFSDISRRGILTPMFAVSPAGIPSGTAHQPTCSTISCSTQRAEVHAWIMISESTVVGWSTCTMAFPSTRNLSYFLQFGLTLRSCCSTIVTIAFSRASHSVLTTFQATTAVICFHTGLELI